MFLPPRKPSLRRLLTRALVMPVLGTAALGYVTSFGSVETVVAEPTQSVTHADVLMSSHLCWTGPSPYGPQIPEHAVYSLPGQEAVYGPSSVAFEIWLGPDGSPGTSDEHPGTVYAFCL